jgi:hypothetical protein
MVKKYLPFIILAVGAFVLVLVFLIIRKGSTKTENALEENVAEIAFDKRAVASLTPSEDGHWLKLKIDKLLTGAKTLDYELLYKLPDGRTQGVPGTVKLDGNAIERDLLLGSESSGKFRYDEGVEQGTLSLRFRNDKGKLVGKLVSDFHLQTGVSELSSVDGNFKYKFNKLPKDDYFVTMQTFGVEKVPDGTVETEPYGIFSLSKESLSGTVSLNAAKILSWTGSDWQELKNGQASGLGVFMGVSE